MTRAVLVALSAVTAVVLHREGPPAAHTGGFGEPTCATACHLGEELNAAGGQLQLLGAPARYEPGRRYTLTVLLRRTPLAIGGFELAARFEDGAQAGVLRSIDRRVRIAAENGIQYAHHTPYGISARADALRWQIVWQAPVQPGTVIFHVAANASNDDASNLGDFIYTMSARTFGRAEK